MKFGLQIPTVLVLFLGIKGINAQPSFHERATSIIEANTTIRTVSGDVPKYGFWYAQANFAKGNEADALKVLNQTFSKAPQDPPFAHWAAMDAFLRWESRFDQTLRNRFKKFMTTFTGYNEGHSQNHKIMLATGRYLASEQWAAGDFTTGTTFSKGDATGKKFLLSKMEEWVNKGVIEHDSPIYIMFHLGPLRTLADFAQDAEIRKRAQLAYEWLLVNSANEWMAGHQATSSLRNLYPFDSQNEYYETDFLLWMYFGGVTPKAFTLKKTPRACFSIGAALSEYRLPPIIKKLATARDTVFANRETHAMDTEWPLTFKKTTFMHQDQYAVYSQLELPMSQSNGLNQQSHRWGVVWKSVISPDEKSAFWVKHARKDIAKIKAGTTKYEQVLQKNGTLAIVFNLPETDDFPYAEGFVPQGYRACIDTPNKVYFHYGNVLIGLLSPKAIDWHKGQERIRLSHPTNGLIVETANPKEFNGNTTAQLQAFKNEIENENRSIGTEMDGEVPKLVYRSIHGYKLSIEYNGHRNINGVDVHYGSWPLMENPWVKQPLGSPILEINIDGMQRVYDFESWKVYDSHNNKRHDEKQ